MVLLKSPERLRRAGHDVCAPRLSGLGDRRHLPSPAIDLDTHIADIVNLIDYEELEDSIHVEYGCAGIVITGVADRVPHTPADLVYLDAVRPGNGDRWSIAGRF